MVKTYLIELMHWKTGWLPSGFKKSSRSIRLLRSSGLHVALPLVSPQPFLSQMYCGGLFSCARYLHAEGGGNNNSQCGPVTWQQVLCMLYSKAHDSRKVDLPPSIANQVGFVGEK